MIAAIQTFLALSCQVFEVNVGSDWRNAVLTLSKDYLSPCFALYLVRIRTFVNYCSLF